MNNPWIDYGKTWLDFWNDGLCVPGTLVDVAGESYLIGHVNVNGGVCDCCAGIKSASVVKRYRVMIDESEMR